MAVGVDRMERQWAFRPLGPHGRHSLLPYSPFWPWPDLPSQTLKSANKSSTTASRNTLQPVTPVYVPTM
jgi:hypothetical protein